MSKKRHRCLNSACHCVCDKETEYCSQECEDIDGESESCPCGHDQCFPYNGPEPEEMAAPR